MRVTKDQAAANKEAILMAASRLYRKKASTGSASANCRARWV